jgi:predicted outer membrane repeat protein
MTRCLTMEGRYKMAKSNFLKILTITFLLTIFGVTTASGKVIYVDDDASGVNDGSSWENAYTFLQDALAAASAGVEIRVAQGVYTPDSNSVIPDGTGDREATFQLANDISLLGGYAGIGSINPNARDIEAYKTILSGDLNGDDIDVNNPEDLDSEPTREENSYHVVTSISNVNLDGFTITCGNANELLGGRGVSNYPYNNGGGIYNLEGQLSLVNCTLTRNFANANGGGMYDGDNELNLINCTFTGNSARTGTGGGIYDSDGDLIITECTFKRNIAGNSGGGIFDNDGKLNMNDCTITGNNAATGGGIYTNSEPTIDNCTFIENSAGTSGGGIYNSRSEIPLGDLASNRLNSTPSYPSEQGITNCTFIENTASLGAGIYNNNTSPTITNCKFIRNATNLRGGGKNSGGGMYNYNSSPTITNCVFTDNFSAQDGGGIYNEKIFEWRSSGDLILTNCMFNGNRARFNGGALYINVGQVYLINCTFAQNSAEAGATLACESFGPYDCTAHIFNCILRDGDNGIWFEENSSEGNLIVYISYSNIYGGWPGEGNIDEDPLFVDILGPDHTYGTEDDNLRLAPLSPCINAGDPNYPAGPNETDLGGNPRIVGALLDMGAYEFQGTIYVDDDAPEDTWRGEPEIDYPEEDGTEARPFDTIQEAIDIAEDGYTVLVRPGVYDKIDFGGKAITVSGIEGAPIIDTTYHFSPPHGRSGEEILMEDAVTFHTGEGPGSVLKNFVIRNSNIAISLNFSSPKIHNVTIADNNFGIAAYENSDPDIRNCILWNNRDGDLFQCEARYSCIESRTQGEGNIYSNPLFVDAANGDYHLKSEGWRWNTNSQSWTWDDVTSRCIDAGDPSFPVGDELMSVPRDPDNTYGVNRYINMGAFGGTCQASMPPRDWLFPADDIIPPVPDPAQWALNGAPREVYGGGGTFDYWIEMEAKQATDASGLVEYFFECTTEPGFSSGWQTSNEYSVQIGRGEQLLRFRVKARDLYLNETEWSDERTAH